MTGDDGDLAGTPSGGLQDVDGCLGQAWPERCRGGAGVQDDPGDETLAEPVPELSQPLDIARGDGCGRLDLDRGDAAIVGLQDEVDLDTVTVPAVEQPGVPLGPGELAAKLSADEPFQQQPGHLGVGRHPGTGGGDIDQPAARPVSYRATLGRETNRWDRFVDHAGSRWTKNRVSGNSK